MVSFVMIHPIVFLLESSKIFCLKGDFFHKQKLRYIYTYDAMISNNVK